MKTSLRTDSDYIYGEIFDTPRSSNVDKVCAENVSGGTGGWGVGLGLLAEVGVAGRDSVRSA